jgi:hypothetical protein
MGFVCNLNSKFLYIECEFLDLSLICSSVLLKSQVIFFFLSGSQSPLLKLFLVPVHLQLELIHPFIGFKDHILDVIQSVLLVCDSLFKLINLIL